MESVKNARFDLDALQYKGVPNNTQENGVIVKITEYAGEMPKEPDNTNQGLEEGRKRTRKTIVKNALIANYHYNEVVENLKKADVLGVKRKQTESQMDKEAQNKLLQSIQEQDERKDVKNADEDAVENLETSLEIVDEEVEEEEEEEEEKEMPKEGSVEAAEKEKSEKMPKQGLTMDEEPEKLEKTETPKESSVVIVNRKKKGDVKTYGKTDLRKENLMDDRILNLLPKRSEPHKVRVSSYYLANRKKYIQKLVPMFSKYKKMLTDDTRKASCEDGGSDANKQFRLLVHQQVVRDYLNLFTPYRGLLLYHGLGSGKTCSSIAIAEGMKSRKKVYVLTLASLKANFFEQMKVCGDPLYKLNQYWEFITIEGQAQIAGALSTALNLPLEYIKRQKGAWMVNVKKEPNFDELEDGDKRTVSAQIDEMIRTKYIDLNYNGLTRDQLKKLTNDFTENPFDNSVVVIDEVHNLVSRIVNKVREKKKKSISYRLYEYLMSAENARMVFLSGTPIINYPNEIGVLYNMLRGYVKTWNFPIQVRDGSDKPQRDNILSWFEEDNMFTYDYVQYSGDSISITRNPFGFVNVLKEEPQKKKSGGSRKKKVSTKKQSRKLIPIEEKMEGNFQDESSEYRQERIGAIFDVQHGGGAFEDYHGVALDETGNVSDEQFKARVKKILEKHGLSMQGNIMLKNNLALPETSKEFNNLFVGIGENEMKNKKVFQKRILGLSSYFRGADESLYPAFVPSEAGEVIHVENVTMSSYQFGVYEKIREEEAIREKKTKQQQQQQDFRKQDAEELFKVSSTYKIASRNACNFVFPNPPGRPAKPSGASDDNEEQDEEAEEEVEAIKKRGRKTMKGGDNSDDEEEEEEVPLITDIEEEEVPLVDVGTEIVEKAIEEEEKEKEKEEEVNMEYTGNYKKDIQQALSILKLNEKEYLSPKGLETYSPKFLRILENIQDPSHKGLHLIYSQFRTLEGVGILKLVLEANGFAEFKIRRKGNEGDWEIVESEEDKGKPKFALHTGTETDEEKKIILDVYNSKWQDVPHSIVHELQKQEKENNFMGDAIKVLMITASGAEGINLKNTRYVHLVEPYWHNVRIEQVIGRARRICSHQALPEELRTVQVFMYISVLPRPQNKEEEQKHIQLRLRDVSKLTNRLANELDESSKLGRYVRGLEAAPQVITTDQMLFESAMVKEQVNQQILHAVKESAMDCQLYTSQNKDENLVCFNYGKVLSNAFGSYPTLEQDLAEKDVKDVRQQKIKMVKIRVPDPKNPKKLIDYAFDQKRKIIYSMEQYNRSKITNEQLNPLGKIVVNKDGEEDVQFFK